MKLLISLSYYSPHISGLTVCVKRLAELLAASNNDVTVLTTQYEMRLPQHERVHEVEIIRVPYVSRISKGFIMPQFFSKAYTAVKKNDVVLIALPQVEGIVVAVLAKMMKKKIVCFYVCEVTLENGILSKLVEFALRMLNRMTLSLADEITTLTDDFAKHTDVLKNKHVHGIYPLIVPPKINKDERDMLRNRFPHKKYYIGYLGRIASEKGITFLIETIPYLTKEFGDSFIILLAGPKKTIGEENYQKEINDLLKKYPEFVFQVGELADSQLGAFYSLLDVFVLPSTNNTEAFGMVQVEAMYCGTPVVATDLPGVRVPIKETGMGEVVKLKNVEALARGISKILKNKNQYIQSKEKIEEIFSPTTILKAYEKVLSA